MSSKIRDVLTMLINNNLNEHDADQQPITLFVRPSGMSELVADYMTREVIRITDANQASHRSAAIASFVESYDAFVVGRNPATEL